MRSIDFLAESAATELAKKLPSLEKHDYNTIDKLLRGIAKKHSITNKALHDLFAACPAPIPSQDATSTRRGSPLAAKHICVTMHSH